jgi:hypothetical protein
VLGDVEQALLGSANTSREQPYVPGFLSDLGRLPMVISDGDRELLELWQIPAGVAPSHLEQDPVDSEVLLAVGWRGPYLQLPVGSSRVSDGFGSPLQVKNDGRWLVLAPGADEREGGQGYDADLSVTLLDPSAGVDRIHAVVAGTVTVTATPPSGAWTVKVFAYSPDPLTGKLHAILEDKTAPPGSTTPDDKTPPGSPPSVFHYRFSGSNALTPGLRILRAYAFKKSETDPRKNAFARSPVVTRVLIPGAQTIDLEVP